MKPQGRGGDFSPPWLVPCCGACSGVRFVLLVLPCLAVVQTGEFITLAAPSSCQVRACCQLQVKGRAWLY